MKYEILVIGSINYDTIVKVPHLPSVGETVGSQSIKQYCGGKGANQAVQCAKLGMDPFFVGTIGNDDIGKILKNSLEVNGVDSKYLKSVEEASGQGYVMSANGGEVYSSVYHGANWAITLEDIDDVFKRFGKQTIIVLQMEIPTNIVEYIIKVGKKKGCIIVLNAAPACKINKKIFNSCDYIIFNEIEAKYYYKINFEDIDSLKELNKKFQDEIQSKLIITIGENGVLFTDGIKTLYHPPIQVPVSETTGAGDSFIGGLIYSIVNSFNEMESLKFATCCSAYTIQGNGVQDAMPNLQQVNELYDKMLFKKNSRGKL